MKHTKSSSFHYSQTVERTKMMTREDFSSSLLPLFTALECVEGCAARTSFSIIIRMHGYNTREEEECLQEEKQKLRIKEREKKNMNINKRCPVLTMMMS